MHHNFTSFANFYLVDRRIPEGSARLVGCIVLWEFYIPLVHRGYQIHVSHKPKSHIHYLPPRDSRILLVWFLWMDPGRIQGGCTPNPNPWPNQNCHTRQSYPTPETLVSLLVSWYYSALHWYKLALKWYTYHLLLPLLYILWNHCSMYQQHIVCIWCNKR